MPAITATRKGIKWQHQSSGSATSGARWPGTSSAVTSPSSWRG